ncbi:MAG: MFS transporter [Woeseiaceae bacterium]
MARLQISVIGICCVLNMLDGFDVLAISFAAPPIADEWSIQPAALGLVFSAGLVGMALGSMFIAPLTDLIGRRAMILICLVAISIMMVVTGLTRSVPELIIARALTGLGIGGMLASLTAMVAEYTPDRHRNLTIGLLQAGYPVGGTLGGLLAAWLVPEYGWRVLFFAGALMGAAMIPIAALALPESLMFLLQKQPAKALEKINRIVRGLRQASLDALPPPPESETAGSVVALLTAARRANTLRLWLAFVLNSLTVYFVMSWVPKIVVDAGLPLEQGILAGLFVNAGSVVGIPTLGYLSAKRGLRPLILTFLVLGAGCVSLFGFLGQSVPLLLTVGFLIGFFVMGGFIGLYSVAARIYPTELRTTGIGWTIGVGRFGAIVGPYLGGIMIALQWSTATNFVLFAIPLLVAGFAAFTIRARELQVGPT